MPYEYIDFSNTTNITINSIDNITSETPWPLGKNKGVPLGKLPYDYLEWAYKNIPTLWGLDTKEIILQERRRRQNKNYITNNNYTGNGSELIQTIDACLQCMELMRIYYALLKQKQKLIFSVWIKGVLNELQLHAENPSENIYHLWDLEFQIEKGSETWIIVNVKPITLGISTSLSIQK